MADGYLNICKDCKKTYANKHREENIDTVRAYDRERGKLPHRKELTVSNTRKARARNPLYNKAHLAVSRAIIKGTLVKPNECECCKTDTSSIEAHHEDYTLPLIVVWLCSACHKTHHHGKGHKSDITRWKVLELFNDRHSYF
jgi:hypothetical protein